MDTRYWGPSGWRLLHTIAFANHSKATICEFFETLPYILPCKFCRKSLSEYMTKNPVRCQANLAKWLYEIHNDVNAKLRSQRLSKQPDPPFQEVKHFYEDRLASSCTKTVFEGWEFLFSVAEAHPMSANAKSSTPVPHAPSLEELEDATPLERNRWNVMKPAERLPHYMRFWELLPKVLPFPEWREAASSGCAAGVDWTTRQSTLHSLWSIRCSMEQRLELLNRTSFASMCKELKHNRSGCSASKRGKTCRRKRG